MSKIWKPSFLTNLRLSKMHYLEYCYCLIAIIVISIIIIVIIILYYHFNISLLLLLMTLSPSGVRVSRISSNLILETNSFSPLPSEIYSPFWHKQWCQPQKLRWKVNMRRNENLVCTPINKKEIKNIFYGCSTYTTICYLNQQSHIEKFK